LAVSSILGSKYNGRRTKCIEATGFAFFSYNSSVF
jgi:hypothetical protein